jgi:hypothetical protein
VITASVGTLASGNYDFSFVSGTISINTKALTITANNRSKCFGDLGTIPETEFTATGLINVDTVTSVTLTSSGIDPGADPVTYPIIPSAAAGSGLNNYNINYINGTYTVNALPATGEIITD